MLSIRKATAADYPILEEIFLTGRRQAFHWINPSTFRSSDFTQQTEGEIIYVAHHEDGIPVGFISVWEPDSFVHHLFIAASHRSQGIGRALLDSLTSWLPTPYRLKCLTANTPAMQFYHHLGWHEISRDIDSLGEYALLELFPAK